MEMNLQSAFGVGQRALEEERGWRRGKDEATVLAGAGWLYGIAALTAVSSAAAWLGADWSLLLGLGITQIVDGVAAVTAAEVGAAAGAGVWVVALAIDAVLISLFAFFGWQAGRGRSWAFVSGLQLYALDTAIFVLLGDWLGVGAHALAFFFVYRGLDALREQAARDEQ